MCAASLAPTKKCLKEALACKGQVAKRQACRATARARETQRLLLAAQEPSDAIRRRVEIGGPLRPEETIAEHAVYQELAVGLPCVDWTAHCTHPHSSGGAKPVRTEWLRLRYLCCSRFACRRRRRLSSAARLIPFLQKADPARIASQVWASFGALSRRNTAGRPARFHRPSSTW